MADLRDVIARLADLDEYATLFASLPWGPDSDATCAAEGTLEAGAALASGQVYLLEVSLARDVIETWAAWRNGRSPNADEAVAAVIHYAQTDAYMPAQASGQ